jgi:hypothetical protein
MKLEPFEIERQNIAEQGDGVGFNCFGDRAAHQFDA